MNRKCLECGAQTYHPDYDFCSTACKASWSDRQLMKKDIEKKELYERVCKRLEKIKAGSLSGGYWMHPDDFMALCKEFGIEPNVEEE